LIRCAHSDTPPSAMNSPRSLQLTSASRKPAIPKAASNDIDNLFFTVTSARDLTTDFASVSLIAIGWRELNPTRELCKAHENA
jgi:hypothetical protein